MLTASDNLNAQIKLTSDIIIANTNNYSYSWLTVAVICTAS